MPPSRRAAGRAWAGVFVLVLVASACVTVPRAPSAEEAAIFDTHAGQFIAPATLVARLLPVRYRLLGEVHDNPAHHILRAQLIDALASAGRRPAIVFEQFDLDRDAALQEARSGSSDAEALASAGAFDRKGWQWPLHKPLLEAALRADLPVRAANVSRAALAPVIRSGEVASIPDAWRERVIRTPWDPRRAEILAQEIRESHCGKLPGSLVPRLTLAQRVRDAAMAVALMRDATQDGAVLIAGNGHVRRDLGVPNYLDAPATDIIAVGWIEVDADERSAPDFPAGVAAAHPGFDYLWFTAPVARDDPCARLGPAPASPRPARAAGQPMKGRS